MGPDIVDLEGKKKELQDWLYVTINKSFEGKDELIAYLIYNYFISAEHFEQISLTTDDYQDGIREDAIAESFRNYICFLAGAFGRNVKGTDEGYSAYNSFICRSDLENLDSGLRYLHDRIKILSSAGLAPKEIEVLIDGCSGPEPWKISDEAETVIQKLYNNIGFKGNLRSVISGKSGHGI